MKRYAAMAAAVAAAAVFSLPGFAANTASQPSSLKDIQGYWGQAAVQYFYDNHYVSGTNGQFYPNEDITREGIAAIINNMIGEDGPVGAVTFSDIQGRWSARAIASLVDKQIMQGYSDGTFKPTRKITREEFAVIAYNYMSYKGMDLSVKSVPYADENQISSWARQAVSALAAKGYMTGANNRFQPKTYVTRGEAVNVLYRILTSGASAGNTDVSTPTQSSLETEVFRNIKDTYGSIKAFAGDGIMYWQGDTLRVGVKSAEKREKLDAALMADKQIPSGTVIVQTAKYSYDDYKKLMAQAEQVYRATEATDAEVKTDVDYLNEKVVLTVASISKETQANLNKALGGALRIVIQ
ncbi:S-layer homology domain-containing protein [uncultured Megasphaera sp.]|uniref:S-layer homology domain-containing protein n=1 Tax=uncultured Megasphaera sp. TaxID=165188 RepID=UPI002659D9C5|nr:S-layer homology domain-containing protein [uncultured Megasphaera sp.]